jgi:hypothetical protein
MSSTLAAFRNNGLSPSSRKSTRGRLSHSASLRARQRTQGWKCSMRGVAVLTFTSRRLRLVFCSSEGPSPRSIFVASVAQRETCVSSLSGSGALKFDMSLWSRQAFIGSLSGTCWKNTSICACQRSAHQGGPRPYIHPIQQRHMVFVLRTAQKVCLSTLRIARSADECQE